jgi:hypothetical protein
MADETPQSKVIEFTPKRDPSAIFDNLADLRKASAITVKRKSVLVNVPVGRPANNVYFRVNPDPAMMLQATVIRDEEGTRKAYYFVPPDMRAHPKLEPRLRWVTIVLVNTWPGSAFLLWPVPRDDSLKVWRSEKKAADLAKTHWTMLVWNQEKADYNIEIAEKINKEPEWPIQPFEQLLKLGFADLIPDNQDHPYVRRLRGILD